MFGALISTLGVWWNRLTAVFRRGVDDPVQAIANDHGQATVERENAHPAENSPRAEEAGLAPSRAAPGDSDPLRNEIPAARAVASHPASAATATSPPVVTAAAPERQDTEQSLIEVLCVESLPVTIPRAPADPRMREQTLAALEGLRQIPALQSLAQGFMRAMSQPEVAVGEVVSSIEKDSALCVRVLRMANSVLVSPEHRIEDLDTAVQMLGVARVRKAAQALFTLRDANHVADGFDWRHLWIHALGTAAIAEELEQQFRSTNDSQVHLAGLLHDVGKIVLSTIAPDAYRDVLVIAWNESGRLEELERERLGVDHREAGVLFARHNGLPPVVLETIAHHNRPEEATEHRFEVALVALANYLSKAHGLGFSGARLDAGDGEFADQSAWAIIEETCGFRPNAEAVEDEMSGFVAALRTDLKNLREQA